MSVHKLLPFQVNDEVVKACIADTELNRDFKARSEESHVKLWEMVMAHYPELNNANNYKLNCKFAAQGIVMLEEGRNEMDDLMERLKDALEQ